MDSDELITQVDEYDNVIGLRPRSEFEEGKLIHRSSYLLVLSAKNQILLHRRPLSKKWYPGKWTFAIAGSVTDETYEECIRRQTREAFGKEIKFKELFKYQHFDNVDKAFKTVFLVHLEDQDLSVGKNYVWISLDKLKNEMAQNPEKYAPPFVTGIKIAFNQKLI